MPVHSATVRNLKLLVLLLLPRPALATVPGSGDACAPAPGGTRPGGLLIGDPGQGPPRRTSDGLISRNDIRLQDSGNLRCHPDTSTQGQEAIQCGRVCDLTFNMNRLQPNLVDAGCSSPCP